jgi:hypothetical protein
MLRLALDQVNLIKGQALECPRVDTFENTVLSMGWIFLLTKWKVWNRG